MLRKLNYSLLILMTSPVWAEVAGKVVDAEDGDGMKFKITSATDIVVPVAFFICIIAIVAIAMAFKNRNHESTHKTLQLMVEKGVPVSPELFYTQANRQPKSALHKGVTLIAVGAALIIALALNVKEGSVWAYGLIPLCMGVGFLIVNIVENKQKKA